jgi:signal transduction histidine kinase
MQRSPEPLPVLIVDDDTQMLRTIGDILRLRGYSAMLAPSGQRGLEITKEAARLPAIALVDLRLPDMDGMELVSEIRKLSDTIEIVILTGNASVDSAVRALRQNSYDYLIKPVQPEQLLGSIERAGERWQRRRAESAMHESEERLRRIFEHVGDALFITDKSGLILDANPAACALTSTPLEQLRNRELRGVLGVSAAPSTESIDESPTLLQGELRLKGHDSELRTVDAQSAAFAPGLLVHTLRDLTHQRHLEEELHHSQKMDAIGKLAGGVAHDFNNLLTVITSYTTFLLESFDETDARREDATEIKQAAARAAQLTRQLLAFSRKQVVQPRPLVLNSIVVETEKMLRRLIGEDVELLTKLAPDLFEVRADAGQLEQVVMNLAVNARDAMPQGGRLSIETSNVRLSPASLPRHARMPDGEYVTLSVSDTGTGIPDEVQSHIFEPFFTTKEAGKGTGLGLSTVYGIVKQAGGDIRLDTEIGRGTTFTIYLPRFVNESKELEGAVAAGEDVESRGHETVLLVEDEEHLRGLAVRILSAHGYTVLTAIDGVDAIRQAKEYPNPIHLVLSDVVMPRMSGRLLSEQLVSARPRVKVLFMSGYTDDDVMRRGIFDRRTAFLEKPFTPEQLVSKVRQVLDAA